MLVGGAADRRLVEHLDNSLSDVKGPQPQQKTKQNTVKPSTWKSSSIIVSQSGKCATWCLELTSLSYSFLELVSAPSAQYTFYTPTRTGFKHYALVLRSARWSPVDVLFAGSTKYV